MAKADCSALALKITELAMEIGSEPGVTTLDEVVKRMAKVVPSINRQIVVDSIVEATEGEAKVVDQLVKNLNAIKQEARTDKALQRKITQLEDILSRETLPGKARNRKKGTEAIERLRSIRDDLKKRLSKSEPVVKDRIQKQIKKLETRIESGDILPKPRVVVPKSKELERLEFNRDELQREIRRQINNEKPKTIFERFVQNPFNAARNIITAYDFSAVFRQGGFVVVGHPVRAMKALIPMFDSFLSDQRQASIEKAIQERPNAPLYRKAGLFLAPTDGTYKLGAREESMQTNIFDKVPGGNKIKRFLTSGVRASNRAYATFLNVLRADSFDIMAAALSKDGDVTLDEAKVVANFVNVATGRGSLGKFERAAEGLNVAFFAPRYVASRFQLAGGAFTTIGKATFGKNKRVQRKIAVEYARYLIGMAAVYALAALTLDDEDFEWDPRSSDFGKIRIGNTRLDPLSGMSQVTVLVSRLVSGEVKSATSGQIRPIRGEDVGFGKSTTADIIGQFLRYKLSPMFGTTLNILTQETAVHEPFGIEDLPKDLLIPIALREIFETMTAQGMSRGTALSMLAIFGMGIQTYGSHISTWEDSELKQELRDVTYKKKGRIKIGQKRVKGKMVGGRKVFVLKGQAHRGKEEYVIALKKELAKRSK